MSKKYKYPTFPTEEEAMAYVDSYTFGKGHVYGICSSPVDGIDTGSVAGRCHWFALQVRRNNRGWTFYPAARDTYCRGSEPCLKSGDGCHVFRYRHGVVNGCSYTATCAEPGLPIPQQLLGPDGHILEEIRQMDHGQLKDLLFSLVECDETI
ncbi:hypothetical protein JDV02_006029 [Purpureocillium takamizusanense]|uniref:Uncharacterized protein n=1 Tax=Purpureocillium takamizusanense TaxID=2060973 RepID=A0A9Q8QHR2_9HYPO|nr:uncharacterized protein JDV02_006029 [Purpureocillium takamizusanense]UNI19885.1 hypothetical protein JDV02_006029 [Purpureocillium takamizusanense]